MLHPSEGFRLKRMFGSCATRCGPEAISDVESYWNVVGTIGTTVLPQPVPACPQATKSISLDTQKESRHPREQVQIKFVEVRDFPARDI